jgi:mediator of RNA polymerase II transcription subunit 14
MLPPPSRQPPTRTLPHAANFQLPLLGGTLRIELRTTPDPIRKPRARVLMELQDRAKLGRRRPSDTVEGTAWHVVWEPAPLALGITLTIEGAIPVPGELTVVRAGLCSARPEVVFDHVRVGHTRSRLRTPLTNGHRAAHACHLPRVCATAAE